MAHNNEEIESKFYVRNLAVIEKRLVELGSTCIVPRGFEYNLRFDDAQNGLQSRHQVLRLRKFDDIRLTYKGPGKKVGNAYARQEVELVVNDFDQARLFLECLGFHLEVVYEKYRAMYQLGSALITLDELPYGLFVEIEAETSREIEDIAKQLHLDPQTAIPASYQGLFEQVRQKKNLPVKNLSFEEFINYPITAADLGVSPADLYS